MGKALYRTYRSRGFDEVVGQRHITDLLSNALKKGAVSHAYLFTGPKGVGKTSVARILAYAINDLPYSDKPHLDIIEIDAASNRRIDDIRDLRDKVHIAPASAPYKVYIIDEVHMLTGESFNALLKTLEEPPAHVVFILATTELHKVPATIISRTQRFHFRPVDHEGVMAHLRHIADKESIGIDDDALRLIADHGEGSFRDSISLLDQVSALKDGKVTADDIGAILGLASGKDIDALLDNIIGHKPDIALASLRGLLSQGSSPATVSLQLMRAIAQREASPRETYELLDELLQVGKSSHPQLKLIALVARYATAPAKPKTAHLSIEPLAVLTSPMPTRTPVRQKPRNESKAHDADATPKPAVSVEAVARAVASVKPVEGFDWNTVLGALQQRNTALHSVLKRAHFMHEEGIVTLTFDYSLHMKKLENNKYRSQLTGVITTLFGGCPELVIKLKDPSDSIKDETAKGVAAIMGGGEQVNVPQ